MSRTLLFAIGVAAAIAGVLPLSAEPGGCLKYGAGGAVAGHLVHHGVRGAVFGCAVGMYRRHEYRKQIRREDAEGVTAPAAGVEPDAGTAVNPIGR